MSNISRTWWGQRFLTALESFCDSNRLQRGRAYVKNGKITHTEIDSGFIFAQVRGSINHYFGVYEEPLYNVIIDLPQINSQQWAAVIEAIAAKAGLISRLLLKEMPDDIESVFESVGVKLLPRGWEDFATRCSCPDYMNPCKHIAGVCYLLAAKLDHDPFLLFELRGLPRESLYAELAKSSLGQALVAELQQEERSPQVATSYYTRPELVSLDNLGSLRDFWQSPHPFPTTVEPATPPPISAILIKKMGDNPAFWERDNSFIEVMAELYERVRTKNKDLF